MRRTVEVQCSCGGTLAPGTSREDDVFTSAGPGNITSALDVVEAFIASEVGWHDDGMRVQAQDLLDALAREGFDVVRAP